MERELRWEGCFNVRDLGGLSTRNGGRTRRGALVRADGLNRLTGTGWRSLQSHGVRTVVDLRNDDELERDLARRPPELTTVRVPIDDVEDRMFWDHVRTNELDGSPLYFRLFLERKPHRCVAVLKEIAHAPPGGVVFHCGRGRDRAGLVTLLALALVGVSAEDIALDYELSTAGVKALDAALGVKDQAPQIAEILNRKKTSSRTLIFQLLEEVDIRGLLSNAGFGPADAAALRERLVDPQEVIATTR